VDSILSCDRLLIKLSNNGNFALFINQTEYHMFYLIGVILAFFLAVILMGKKGKTEADRILVLWLFSLGLNLFFFYLFITGKYYSLPHFLGYEMPFPLLYGPLMYLYTEALTNQINKRKLRFLHFTPFLFSYLLILPFLLLPSENKIFVYENKGLGYEMLTGTIVLAIAISGIVYVFLSLRLLVKHKQIIHNHFSYSEKINLAWLRYLIYGIAGIWIIVIFFNDTITYTAVVVFVILLGYFGINQVGIFTGIGSSESKEDKIEYFKEAPLNHNQLLDTANSLLKEIEEQNKKKYHKSSLNDTTAKEIHTTLSKVMIERKLYTNPEISLAELAQELNVHPNNLSQVINTYEEKSFYDYINLMRVEEFKRVAILSENQKFSLMGLAYNCGFNSKTSFNRNFKNTTGLSPSEYLKKSNILLEQ